jgi:hypothetical protein
MSVSNFLLDIPSYLLITKYYVYVKCCRSFKGLYNGNIFVVCHLFFIKNVC